MLVCFHVDSILWNFCIFCSCNLVFLRLYPCNRLKFTTHMHLKNTYQRHSVQVRLGMWWNLHLQALWIKGRLLYCFLSLVQPGVCLQMFAGPVNQRETTLLVPQSCSTRCLFTDVYRPCESKGDYFIVSSVLFNQVFVYRCLQALIIKRRLLYCFPSLVQPGVCLQMFAGPEDKRETTLLFS